MKRIRRKEDEEGAMGVGTLIVFIVMVLVAAVATSVLIDTANKLQQQAQKTGDQAIRQVFTSFVVNKDFYGKDTTDSGEIDQLYLKIGLAAGAPAQNLDQTVIQLKNATNEVNLQNGTATDGDYEASVIIEQEGEDNYYLEQGDIMLIQINLNNENVFDGEVGTQEDISLEIMPKHGTPTYEQIKTPPVIVHKHVDLTQTR